MSRLSQPGHSIHSEQVVEEGWQLYCCLQIGTFMTDIADEFKIVVVEAIRSLCLKFPQKYRALMNFLSGVLREDGGFEYKKAIVDSILILIREIPDAKESGLAHLCEFIEVGLPTPPGLIPIPLSKCDCHALHCFCTDWACEVG